MANTPIDQWIRDNYQTKIRYNPEYDSDEINEQSRVYKTFGEGKIMIPVVLGAKFLGDLTNSKNIEECRKVELLYSTNMLNFIQQRK